MATAKAERLLNLVIALLNAGRYRSAQWIHDNVVGYAEAPTAEAFNRTFERDKQELRAMGIPIQTNDEGNYRIPQVEFALPELSFTPAETAALALAGRLWSATSLAGAGAGALRKIRDAAPGDPRRSPEPEEVTATTLLQPRVRTADPAFRPAYDAIRARRAITFDYRKDGARDPETRELEPWGLVSFRGRWYVVGRDRVRREPRTFRLSRITGPVKAVGAAGAVIVPPGVNLLDQVRNSVAPPARYTAQVALRAGRGAGLRRYATAVEPDVDRPGWDRVTFPVSGLWDTARRVAGVGPDARVVSPPALVDAVVRILTAARDRFDPGAADPAAVEEGLFG